MGSQGEQRYDTATMEVALAHFQLLVCDPHMAKVERCGVERSVDRGVNHIPTDECRVSPHVL